MKTVFLGFGSNMGDRYENLKEALSMTVKNIGSLISVSPVYQTEPWGFKADTDFLNMVICIETQLTVTGLLGRILMIESGMGRLRNVSRYSSRVIDIDILFYANEIINREGLVIPHPRLHERRFVLQPLSRIAPDLVHPLFKKTITGLLEECQDKSKVTWYSDRI
jgi:deoxyguanosine kinase